MNPTTIQEIERAIGTLTPQEVQELYLWLDQHFPQPIDARIEADLAAGRLDRAIHRALDDDKNEHVRAALACNATPRRHRFLARILCAPTGNAGPRR